ncbi:MAG: aromatic ring-hydroxylating dioxygenase subunit alpha [Alphaproteobacteria bacterium]|nr:aromatic ring-hydroxylating dioxygenase subunit alpha [Alphaproteobacteria bacterium]
MENCLRQNLIKEINGYYEADTTKLSEREMEFPASGYYDKGQWERERAMLLRFPVMVGHSSSLKKPGDMFTRDEVGIPVIVSRQENGSLKAFQNICRHRGARLCNTKSGAKKTFVCPYHSWTFKNDGSLLKIPREEGFPNTNKADHALVELPVEERHGFIWVVHTPGATIDVAAFLGPLDEELASYALKDYVLERDVVLEEDMNWKFVLDGFLEVYHISYLHFESIGPYIYGKYSPFDAFAKHSRLVGIRKSFDRYRETGGDPENFLEKVAVNYQLFPNTILVWQGDHFESWTAYPGDKPEHCRVRVQSMTTARMAEEDFTARWDKNWKILIDTVVAEDWGISKTVQAGAQHVKDDKVIFGRNELGLQHFHTEINKETAVKAKTRGPARALEALIE